MPQIKSWVGLDAFWARSKPLCPSLLDQLGASCGVNRVRAQADGCPTGVSRHRLCAAHRMPMESVASRIRQCQCGPRALSALATLRCVVYPRPRPRNAPTESLCMDAGYVGYEALVTTRKQNYRQNQKTRHQETNAKSNIPGHIAQRWVIERTHSWFNRFANCSSDLK
jgi:hypothetical protein